MVAMRALDEVVDANEGGCDVVAMQSAFKLRLPLPLAPLPIIDEPLPHKQDDDK
jgi:hypothetical protein